jgi:isopenicillin N synthase-like dioxygenase
MTEGPGRRNAIEGVPELVGGVFPLLDVEPYLAGEAGARDRLGAQLRWAFEKVGFYYLRGHGIPQPLIDAMFAQAARFHGLPMAEKLAVEVNADNVGYLPMKSGQFPDRAPSRNAAFFLRREREPHDPLVLARRRLHGLNQWPAQLPGFRETALAYMRAMEALCRRLVPLYAAALDLPPDAFDGAYAEPHLILRLTHYPPLDPDEAASLSLTPHTDSGFMTLLAPNPVPGLSILLPDGRWIDAPAVAGAFVVNGGDILHRWTNERFLSTPHRVINRTGGDRYAIPFFCDPNHDTLIECLPSCRSAAVPPKYPPIPFGDYAVWFARKSYEHMAREPARADAEIAPGARATRRW